LPPEGGGRVNLRYLPQGVLLVTALALIVAGIFQADADTIHHGVLFMVLFFVMDQKQEELSNSNK
jgi:hypothetical protein